MLTPTRIYVSVPNDGRLSPAELELKRGVFDRIRSAGFEPQELKNHGDLAEIPWSHENIQYKLGRCQGVAVLGLVRWEVWNDEERYKFITAYNHYEGALARARDLPTFVLMNEAVHKAGIALKGPAPFFARLPDPGDSSWLETDEFRNPFDKWVSVVNDRRHIYLGYGSTANETASKMKDFLTRCGVAVLDGATDLPASASISERMDRAAKSCMGAVFLLTKSDETLRENPLLFEAGYLMHAKGADKILILAEKGSRIAAGIGGQHILSISTEADISPIEKDLEDFVNTNL